MIMKLISELFNREIIKDIKEYKLKAKTYVKFFSNRKEIFCDGMFTGCPIKDEYRPKGDPNLFIPWYERKNY